MWSYTPRLEMEKTKQKNSEQHKTHLWRNCHTTNFRKHSMNQHRNIRFIISALPLTLAHKTHTTHTGRSNYSGRAIERLLPVFSTGDPAATTTGSRPVPTASSATTQSPRYVIALQ